MTTPVWQPAGKIISSITQANPGVVTTTTPHGYFNGLIVRFFYSKIFGMPQLLGNNYTITVIDSTSFSINQDTTTFEPFSIAITTQSPQVSPVGEVASTLKNAERNLLTPVGGFSP